MIGPGTTVRGTLTGDEDLTVEGRIEGSVRLTKDLEIAEGAVVEADIEAQTVKVTGRVVGDVQANDALEIDASATVTGDVTTPRLVIADGAHFKGKVEMDFEIPGLEKGGRRR